MRKLRVMTVVGTRPEIIRLSRTIDKLDGYCEQVLVHTGQNYDFELNQIFFDDLGIRRPDIFLDAAGKTGAETIGNVIALMDRLLEDQAVDAMLVLGDTNSCFAVLPAKRRKIPTFHMEAGNRCFDQRVPEEINRRIIDHTADVNLTYSRGSAPPKRERRETCIGFSHRWTVVGRSAAEPKPIELQAERDQQPEGGVGARADGRGKSRAR